MVFRMRIIAGLALPVPAGRPSPATRTRSARIGQLASFFNKRDALGTHPRHPRSCACGSVPANDHLPIRCKSLIDNLEMKKGRGHNRRRLSPRQTFRGRFGIRVKLVTSSSGLVSGVCPARLAFSDAPDAPAIPLKTRRSLDAGSGPFSGRHGRLPTRAAEHTGFDRLPALHQGIDSTCFLGQSVPCDRVLHVSSTYPIQFHKQGQHLEAQSGWGQGWKPVHNVRWRPGWHNGCARLPVCPPAFRPGPRPEGGRNAARLAEQPHPSRGSSSPSARLSSATACCCFQMR